MAISDEMFLRFTRDLNPGDLLAGQPLAPRVNCHEDMRQNLWILYALCVGLRAKDILEIGVDDGTSTLAFLKAAGETGGHVTSVDIGRVSEVARAIMDQVGVTDEHWTFLLGDSKDVLPSLRSVGKRYDVILVDGDHTYEGAKRDVEHCGAMLREHGFLLVHDSMMFRDGDNPGCGYAVHELFDDDAWQGIVLPFNCSLSIFQKRADAMKRFAEGEACHPFGYPPRKG